MLNHLLALVSNFIDTTKYDKSPEDIQNDIPEEFLIEREMYEGLQEVCKNCDFLGRNCKCMGLNSDEWENKCMCDNIKKRDVDIEQSTCLNWRMTTKEGIYYIQFTLDAED